MLVKTDSLRHLLGKKNITSEDILEICWKKEGNVYSVIPRDSFIEVKWEDLASTPYAVMSYMWKSKWDSIVDFILLSDDRVLQKYMWIDVLCLDQMGPDKMATVRRSDEIYYHAKEYHLMEIDSLFRGWVLYELSNVKAAMLPPAIHITTQNLATIDVMRDFLLNTGFNGCQFTVESDREIVQNAIIDRYGSIDEFNLRILFIVDQMFV